MIFIFFAAMVSITVIVTILLREFYSRREHDVGPCCCCFPFFQRRRRRHLQGLHASDDGETAQVRSDREFAQQVFRQLQTEMREEQKIARRQERRAWYELYLKPFTMVATTEDFVDVRDDVNDNVNTNGDAATTEKENNNDEAADVENQIPSSGMQQPSTVATSSATSTPPPLPRPCRRPFRASSTCTETECTCDTSEAFTCGMCVDEGINDDDDDDDDILAKGKDKTSSSTSSSTSVASSSNEETDDGAVFLDDDDQNDTLRVRLPLTACQHHHGCNIEGEQRLVDAHCAICLGVYEADDQVVWSNLKCRHAFHYDCILPWLIKGKKRCPICRHWFVPSQLIHEQKAEWERRQQHEQTEASTCTQRTESRSSSMDLSRADSMLPSADSNDDENADDMENGDVNVNDNVGDNDSNSNDDDNTQNNNNDENIV